jgi:micrococcal nuclease
LIILNKTYSIWILKPSGHLRFMEAPIGSFWRAGVIGALLVLLLTMLALSQVQAGEHAVSFVSDGDTIVLRSGERVRYLGIDAPEMDNGEGKREPLAQVSKNFNRRLVQGVTVGLTYDQERRDDYGRLLAYVFLQDGRMVNALMVQEGLAVVMLRQPNTRYRDFLVACQREAMQKRIGLWEKLPDREAVLFVGNSRSFRFHREDCASLVRVPKGKRIRFRSPYEAFWAGYSPCKRCSPADQIEAKK